MEKKKIVICADYFAPGFKAGGPIQSILNVIAILAQEFEVYVLTRNHDWGDDLPYNIPTNNWQQTPNCKICYLLNTQINYKFITAKIQEVNPAFVYINSLYSVFTRAVFKYILLKKPSVKFIIAPRGELNSEAINLKKYVKIPYLKLIKLLNISKKLTWHVTSTKEQQSVKSYFGSQTKTFLLANIPKQTQEDWVKRQKEKNKVKFLVVGRIDKMKNIHFIFQQFSNFSSGEIQVDVIGSAKDELYCQFCVQLANQLAKNIKINFIGALPPTDIEKAMPNYHFFISPTLGENFGHAIFESLLAGLPVLISDRTPWVNLENYNAGWIISLNETTIWQAKLKACIEMDELEYNSYSRAAWMYAKQYNNQSNYRQNLNSLFY